MKAEKGVARINNFKPRDYQIPIINALEHEGFKKLIIILPRRSGKDVVALNMLLRQAFKRVGVYFYLLPHLAQARRVIWDSILITGERFLDFIPDELILKKNETQMKIWLINGSQIQLNGSDNIDSLLGTNPMGIIFSEYSSVQNEDSYPLMRPILAANGGFCAFVSTPKGHNHFWDLYKNALKSTDWHVTMLTVDDTKHILPEVLAVEKREMSDEKFLQEYYCSFDATSSSTYYAKYVELAYVEGRIGFVPHDPAHQVHTACDLGWASPSVLIFYQVIGRKICVINTFQDTKCDIAELVSVLRSYSLKYKYNYGSHFAPHDATTHSQNDGCSRLDLFNNLGIEMIVLRRTFLNDGIEVTKHMFNRIWINEDKCGDLIAALEHYSKKWDNKGKRYLDTEKKDWSNDFCDVFRYMCGSIDYISTDEGETSDDKYNRVVLGNTRKFSPVFDETR